MHDSGGAQSYSTSRGDMNVGQRDMYTSSVDSLTTYLERPVLVDTLDWGINITLYESYNILRSVLYAAPIENRLRNFANISFNLEISIEVSANPFLYGMLLMNWVPYPKYDGLLRDRGLFPEDSVAASQRQRLFIDASTSSGGKMTIPFFWPANYFSLAKDNPDDFGYLSVRQLNKLRHVSGQNQSVTVYIRARMTDVRMHTSTRAEVTQYPEMSLQADESPDDKLSSTATRVANIAGSLTPIFGSYAMATERAARFSAAALRALGLSHPRSKEMTHKLENRPLGNTSNFNTPSSALTLALDEHNEVTIDPQITGMNEDEMSFDYILKKESYIGTYEWTISDAEGSILAAHRVNPMQFAYSATGPEYHLAPIAYLSRLFQYWTGTIIFRFQIVISAWHRGRLRFIHEPIFANTLNDNMWQTNVQSIVDIAENREFEIEVSFAQAQEWLETGELDSALPSFFPKSSGTAYAPLGLKESNGTLLVAVMNKLVIPDDTIEAPAYINVYVRAGNDFQLACPRVTMNGFSVKPQISPPPSGDLQNLNQKQVGMIRTPIGNIVDGTSAPPVFNADTPPNIRAFLGPTSHPVTLTVEKIAGLGTTIQMSSTAGSSDVVSYDGSNRATVVIPMPTGAGYTDVTTSVEMDANALVKIVSATVPVKENQEWRSAFSNTPPYDSINDMNPSVSWPLTMLNTGSPAIFYVAGSIRNLYQTSNNNQPVYITYNGDIKIVNGVYSPTLHTFDAESITTSSYVPPASGYGATRVNIGSQLTTATGIVYNVVFLHDTSVSTQANLEETGYPVLSGNTEDTDYPVLETQADMKTEDVATPGNADLLSNLHDTQIDSKIAMIYMGEKMLHLRQILGRPIYIKTDILFRNSAGYTRATYGNSNIPNYPAFDQTPLSLLMPCYNAWHGSTRMKYIIIQPVDAPASFTILYRNSVGDHGEFATQFSYDLDNEVDRELYLATNPSFWGGAIITNPNLANEIQAEFPYYYRFRFRSSRTTDPTNSVTTSDVHTLIVDTYQDTRPILIERFFQPGEDFSLFNWMGTPVLYPTT